MLVEKSNDGILAENDLEALHFCLNLLRRKAFRDLNPPELGDDIVDSYLLSPQERQKLHSIQDIV